MNDKTYEGYEISIKFLLYHIVRRWRRIIICVLAAAVAVFCWKSVNGIKKINSSQETLQQEYDSVIAEHNSKGQELQGKIKNLELELETQRDYNSKSYFMQMDHLNVWTGCLQYYVDSHYQVILDSQLQNDNPAGLICAAYQAYFESGNLCRELADMLELSDDIDLKYIEEVFDFNVDTDNYLILIEIRQVDEETCRKWTECTIKLLDEKHEELSAQIAEHDLNCLANSVYSIVDHELNAVQQENELLIENIENELKVNRGELLDWKNTSLSLPSMSVSEVIKDAVKIAMIVALAVALIIIVFTGIGYLCSGKILDSDELNYSGLLIAQIPEEAKGKTNVLDRLFARIFSISMLKQEKDARIVALSRLVSSKASKLDSNSDNRCVALVSDMSVNELEKFVENLNIVGDKTCTFIAAGNPYLSEKASENVEKSDAVLLVAKRGYSDKTLINSLYRSQQDIYNKNVLGIVLIEAYSC